MTLRHPNLLSADLHWGAGKGFDTRDKLLSALAVFGERWSELGIHAKDSRVLWTVHDDCVRVWCRRESDDG
jgi:hypothetical protein